MSTFVLVTIILLATDCAGKLYLLALGKPLERTTKNLSWDIICNFALIVFGAVVLASGK